MNNDDVINDKTKRPINDDKIFIIEKKLNNINIMKTIEYFTSTKKIPIKNIAIACVISEHNMLQQLGQIYPNIKVYTTKILYNKS